MHIMDLNLEGVIDNEPAILVVATQTVACDVCLKSFLDKRTLSWHVKNAHQKLLKSAPLLLKHRVKTIKNKFIQKNIDINKKYLIIV